MAQTTCLASFGPVIVIPSVVMVVVVVVMWWWMHRDGVVVVVIVVVVVVDAVDVDVDVVVVVDGGVYSKRILFSRIVQPVGKVVYSAAWTYLS